MERERYREIKRERERAREREREREQERERVREHYHPIYKEKGDHMNCTNYNGIKLLSHTMNLWERIIHQRLRDIVSLSGGQFDFKPGDGTTDAIFAIRTLCE